MSAPVILGGGEGFLITDRPLIQGGDPVIVYIEDFPDLKLKDGDRLRIGWKGGEEEGVARHRVVPPPARPATLAPRRDRRLNKRNRKRRRT